MNLLKTLVPEITRLPVKYSTSRRSWGTSSGYIVDSTVFVIRRCLNVCLYFAILRVWIYNSLELLLFCIYVSITELMWCCPSFPYRYIYIFVISASVHKSKCTFRGPGFCSHLQLIAGGLSLGPQYPQVRLVLNIVLMLFSCILITTWNLVESC